MPIAKLVWPSYERFSFASGLTVVDIRGLVTAFSVFELAENREDGLSYIGIATLVVRVWIPDGILDHLYQLIHLITAT